MVVAPGDGLAALFRGEGATVVGDNPSTEEILLAVRETALFTPEASPECLPETEFIAVVVSGAMTRAIPKPMTTTAGKKVVQYEPPVPVRANRTKPAAVLSATTTGTPSTPS